MELNLRPVAFIQPLLIFANEKDFGIRLSMFVFTLIHLGPEVFELNISAHGPNRPQDLIYHLAYRLLVELIYPVERKSLGGLRLGTP